MRQTTLHVTRVSDPCILFWINAFSFLLPLYVMRMYRNFSTSTFVKCYQDTAVSFALLLFPQYRLRITNRSFKSDNKTDETLSYLRSQLFQLVFLLSKVSLFQSDFFNRILSTAFELLRFILMKFLSDLCTLNVHRWKPINVTCQSFEWLECWTLNE